MSKYRQEQPEDCTVNIMQYTLLFPETCVMWSNKPKHLNDDNVCVVLEVESGKKWFLTMVMYDRFTYA